MKTMANGLRNKILTAVFAVFIAGAIPGSIYLHNAWGDDRYVTKVDDIRDQIKAIDHSLFEIDQEISFSDTDKDRAKWEARKNYYLREKEALSQKLSDSD